MVLHCHRCGGEVQSRSDDRSADDPTPYCPHCGAPQLKLPEHMRSSLSVAVNASTTGALPPPMLEDGRQIEWRIAIACCATVAVISALLTIAGLKFGVFALLGTVWILSSGVITLGLYVKRARRLPRARRVGFKLGLVTGLLMIATVGVAGTAVGVFLRFGTQKMTQFDEQSAVQTKATQEWMVAFLARQGQDKAAQTRYLDMLNSPLMTSPEMKAGGELASLAFESGIVLIFCAAGGAFAEMFQNRRLPRETT